MNYLEAWPDSVDGAETLYRIEAQLRRYASMPDGSPELVSLWVQFTWVINASQIAPRLLLTSPIRRCGKTTVLNILWSLVHAPQSNINVTPAALYNAIDQKQCTLLLDEADNWISKRGQIPSILSAGHSRDTAYVPRVIGGELVEYSVYAPIAIAAIGRALPPTLEDRSIIVRMRRKRPEESLEKFRKDRTDDLAEFAGQLGKIVGAILAKLLQALLWPLASHPHDDRAVLKRRWQRPPNGSDRNGRIHRVFDEFPANHPRHISGIAAMPGVEDARNLASFADPVVGFVQKKGALLLIDGIIESGRSDVDIGLRRMN